MKIQLMVIFGGKSVEHEISVISAIQAINHVNKAKYDVIPVYVSKNQELYTGDDVASVEAYKNIPALLAKSTKVVLTRDGDKVYLAGHPSYRKFRKFKRQIDIAFPVVHGSNVEDGTLQGYLKSFGLPFVGCDVISSAAGMDKHVMKTVLRDYGIPVLDAVVHTKFEYDRDADAVIDSILSRFELPVIVKPATLGSSIGISKAKDKNELRDALDTAFSYAVKVLTEPAITALREINCSVIGDIEEADASECEEPLNATDILSFEDKYMGSSKNAPSKNSTDSQGMASLSRKIPADIPSELRAKIRKLAADSFTALGCNGVSRIDFLYDTENEKIYVNEINTIPGSLSFYLWEPLGVSYESMIERLIDLALKREREEKGLISSFDTNVLSLCSDGALGGGKTKLKV